MLTDRRELLEHAIKKAHDMAAHMYLDMVVHGYTVDDEYQTLRTQISQLEFDLNIVNQLIHKGN